MARKPKNFPSDKSGGLFPFLYEKYHLTTDRELSAKTGIARPIISKIRNGKQEVSNSNLVYINESTNIPIRKLRELIAGKTV